MPADFDSQAPPPVLVAGLAGRYRLERELGAGGMARVFLARDLKHDRQVAVKVLRPELSAALGPDRFLREIQIAAGLHHPHIVPLYDSGAVDPRTLTPPDPAGSALLYYVMPFAEGESLRGRLEREKELPVEEAVRIATEVADALGYAHARGVVHRDIKPENILLDAGHASVTDFGIARAVTASSETRLTEVGLALGTPAYMSPEQAAGDRDVDARSDLYSLGCVLYEMLAGRPPFQSATAEGVVRQHLTGAILPIAQIRPTVPPNVGSAVERLLAKNPADRFAGAQQLVSALSTPVISGASPGAGDVRPGRLAAWALALCAALAAAFLGIRSLRPGSASVSETPLPPTRHMAQLTVREGVERWPTWSPDGKQLAFVGEVSGSKQLFVRDLATGAERQLTTGAQDDIQPAWSPDGKHIAFVRANLPNGKLEPGDVLGYYTEGGDIWIADVTTGAAHRIIDRAFSPAWSPDGRRLVFDAGWAGSRRLWIADSAGHNPQQLSTDSTESVVHTAPRWSPDGSHIAYQRVLKAKSDILVVDVASKAMSWITDDNVPDLNPSWSHSGRFLYFTSSRGGGNNIWRMAVDARGQRIGAPQQVTTGAGSDVDIAVGPDGKRLAFSILAINSDIARLPVDPATGRPVGAPEAVLSTTREESRGAWSADSKSIAYNSDRLGNMNIWIRRLEDGAESQLTNGPGGDYQPNWAPDGNTIAFFSARSGNSEIWQVGRIDRRLRQLTDGPGTKTNPFYSPDGKLIAFHSDRDGRLEIWLMNADGSGERKLTTSGVGGHFMRWEPDGRSLVYLARSPEGAKMLRIAIGSGVIDTLPVAPGAHMSFSPDHRLIMDVRDHKVLWVSPVSGDSAYKVFSFPETDVRIDYPVWSPDGHWVLFDKATPSGGDIWILDGME